MAQGKIHYHLITSALEVVQSILGQGESATHLLQATLKSNPRWGSRDRKFVSETVYELVRYWRKWHFLALGRDVPAEAPVTLAMVWEAWAGYWLSRGEYLPAFSEVENIDSIAVKERLQQDLPLAVAEAIPDWWCARGERDFGAAWPKMLASLNTPATVCLRTNTLVTTREKLLAALEKSGLTAEVVPENAEALRLGQRVRLQDNTCYREGWFEVQDLGSQGISGLPAVQPGQRVIDLCAGAGGKTLHLAARMQNQGQILACDVEEKKLMELRNRCERAGVGIVQIHQLPAPPLQAWQGTADLVLIDAPCSGSGVLRRQPDTKWRLTESRVAELVATQAALLEQALSLVKPGGTLLYATCSHFSEENADQVQAFLAKHPNVTLKQEKSWWPHELNSDGFYAAEMSVG